MLAQRTRQAQTVAAVVIPQPETNEHTNFQTKHKEQMRAEEQFKDWANGDANSADKAQNNEGVEKMKTERNGKVYQRIPNCAMATTTAGIRYVYVDDGAGD